MAYGFSSTNGNNEVILDSKASYFKLFAEGTVTSSSSTVTGKNDGGYLVNIPNEKNLNPAKCIIFIQPKSNWISCHITREATGPNNPFKYLAKSPNTSFNYRIFYVDEGGLEFKKDSNLWGMELYTETGFKQFSTNHYLMDIEGFVTRTYVRLDGGMREITYEHSQMYNAYYCLHMGMYTEYIYAPGGTPAKVYPVAIRQTSAYGIEVDDECFVGVEVNFYFEYDAYDYDATYSAPMGHSTGYDEVDSATSVHRMYMMYMSPHY